MSGDDRYEKVLFGDSGASQKTVTKMTAQALEAAEKELGYTLTITQGSFNTSVKASAKTHFGGGTVDLTAYDWYNKVRVLRKIGFAAWYRPASSSWPAHIHAVLIGDESAHQQAKDQVASYKRGKDGLAYDRPDNTPELRPAVIRPYVYRKPKPPVPPGVNVIVGHQSGLFDAVVEDWRHGTNALIARGASVVTLTETRRVGLMSRLTPDGWAFTRHDAEPGQGECSIMWKSSIWEPASPSYAALLTDKTYARQGGAQAPPLWAPVQPLRHRRTKDVVLAAALHLPANIQGNAADVIEGPRPGPDAREAVTEDAIRNFDRIWAEGRKRHPGASRVVGADWNLDWFQPFVREWWDKTFPLLTASFEGRKPARGSHGGRLIDWTAFSPHFAVTGAEVLPATAKLDHKGVLTKAKLLEEK